MNKRPMLPETARLRLADLCSRSEQCEADLRDKCRKWQLSASATDEIITWLKMEHFLDETRFAHSYAHDKCIYNGWGRNKLRAMLATKRIYGEIASEAIEAIDAGDYRRALLQAAKNKAVGLDLSEADDRRKLIRHLMSRGFTWPEIKEALKPSH